MSDAARYLLIAGGAVAIGLNITAMVHLPKIVHSVLPWRLYLAGQIFFDLAAMYGVRAHLGQPLGWAAYLVFAAMGLTVGSLAALEVTYRHRNGAGLLVKEHRK